MSRDRLRRGQRGSATVLAVTFVMMLVAAAGVGLSMAGAVVARHRAEAGADLAALAGAVASRQGRAACESAAGVAQANQVRMVGCRTVEGVVTVRVGVDVAVLGFRATAHGQARAGPAAPAQ